MENTPLSIYVIIEEGKGSKREREGKRERDREQEQEQKRKDSKEKITLQCALLADRAVNAEM